MPPTREARHLTQPELPALSMRTLAARAVFHRATRMLWPSTMWPVFNKPPESHSGTDIKRKKSSARATGSICRSKLGSGRNAHSDCFTNYRARVTLTVLLSRYLRPVNFRVRRLTFTRPRWFVNVSHFERIFRDVSASARHDKGVVVSAVSAERGALRTAHATTTRLNPEQGLSRTRAAQSFLHRDEVERNTASIVDDGIGSAETGGTIKVYSRQGRN